MSTVDRPGRASCPVTKRSGISAAGLEHQQVAGRVGLDRGHRAEHGARRRRRTVAPTSSCTQSVAGTSTGSASQLQPRAGASAAVRSVDTLELHDASGRRRRAAGATRRVERRRGRWAGPSPGSRRSVWSRPELDDDLAPQAVGLGDPATSRSGPDRRQVTQSSTMSTLAWTPSLAPATLTSVRMAWAVRPRRPMTRPMSSGATCRLQAQPVAALLGVDHHRLGVVGERLGQVGQHRQRRAALRRGCPPPRRRRLLGVVDVTSPVLVVVVARRRRRHRRRPG